MIFFFKYFDSHRKIDIFKKLRNLNNKLRLIFQENQ